MNLCVRCHILFQECRPLKGAECIVKSRTIVLGTVPAGTTVTEDHPLVQKARTFWLRGNGIALDEGEPRNP